MSLWRLLLAYFRSHQHCERCEVHFKKPQWSGFCARCWAVIR